MKRIKKLLLIMALFTICMFSVKADMGMPDIIELNAIVINENGIRVGSDVLEYNSKIKVSKLGNKIYYNGLYVIKESDIKILDDSFDSSKYETLNGDITVKVINKDGAYLYAGPSLLYPTVGEKISEGTVLKGVKILDYSETFLYVEYNGVSGWLYIYNYVDFTDNAAYVATVYNNTLYAVNSSVTVYDYPSTSSSKKVVSTQKDGILESSCNIVTVPKTKWYYIDKLNGWIYEENFGFNTSEKQNVLENNENLGLLLISSREIPIYKRLDFKDREQTLVPSKTVVDVLYTYYYYDEIKSDYSAYYYINYDGVMGWIKETDLDKAILSLYKGKILHIGNTTTTYKTYDLNNNYKGKNIEYFDEVEGYEFEIYNGFTSSYMYYVKLNDEYVWVKKINKNDMILQNYNNLSVDSNIYIYETTTSNVKGAILKNTYFKEIYSIEKSKDDKCINYDKYVEYLNTNGWVHVSYCKEENGTYVNTKFIDEEEISDERVEEINNNFNVRKIVEEKEEEILENNGILYLVLIGIIVVLTLIVVVIIMFKKSSNKTVYTFN